MTPPMTPPEDFDDHLRSVFQRQADDAPRVDLTAGVLMRAHRLRIRRRVATGTALLVVAAVAVPAGASFLLDQPRSSNIADDDSSNSKLSTSDDSPVDVSLPALARGHDPSVPYVYDDKLIVSGSATSVPRPQTDAVAGAPVLVDAAAFTDGVAGWWRDPGDGSLTFAPGTTAPPLSSKVNASNPVVDQDGSVAWAVQGVEGAPADAVTLLYTDSLAGEPAFGSTNQLEVKQMTAVSGAVAVFNATTADGTQVVGRVNFASSAPQVQTPWPDLASLTAASPGNGLMVGRTVEMTGQQRQCLAMMSYDSAAELWRTCEWIPQEFSPDGSRVFAVAQSGAAFPRREVAVLDAGTGQVLDKLTTSGSFGRATFEDAHTLDIVTVDGGDAAIVRCVDDGSCELATDALPAVNGNLASPYQLTANP